MQALPPLIATLLLDDVSTAFFNELRQTHFPAEINYIDAHLTLFHKLPPGQTELLEKSRDTIRNIHEFSLSVSGLKSLGRGVAYSITSQELKELYNALKQIWLPHLSPQDRQGFNPHITVQNKVTTETARSLQRRLSEGFQPFTAYAKGVAFFSYLNGPWRLEERIIFQSV